MVDTVRRNEIRLGATGSTRRYRIIGDVSTTSVNQFPAKVVTGSDTNRDTEPIASTHIFGDWRGGIGIELMDPAENKDRSWYSTLDTRFARQLFLPPLRSDITTGLPSAKRLDAATQYGDTLYAITRDKSGYQFNGVSWNSSGLTVTEQARDAVSFTDSNLKHWLVFGYGNSTGSVGGYTKWDGTTGTDVAGDSATKPRCYGLAFHNGALWGMDGNGLVWKCLDLGANTWVTGGVLPIYDQTMPPFRQLLVYRNAAGDPTLHCVTRAGLYAYDELNEIWYATELQYPYLSENGPITGGATVWRGDLYLAQGLDVFKYNAGVVTNLGLNKDYGLSTAYSSTNSPIRLLCNAYNWLLAATTEEVFLWDGTGWHFFTGTNTTTVGLSGLWFFSSHSYQTAFLVLGRNSDANPAAQAVPMPISLFNPRRMTGTTYADAGELVSPWFDAAWPELVKTAIEVVAEGEGLTATQTITIYYQIDTGADSDLWTQVAITLNSSSQNNVPQTGAFASGAGLEFYRIRFKVLMSSNSSTLTPVLKYLRVKYLKNLPPRLGYSCTVQINDKYDNQSTAQQWTSLYAAYTSNTLLDFSFRRTSQELVTRKVKVSHWGGPAPTGQDTRGSIQLALVEV